MLADETAHVGAVRTSLAPEAWRVRRVAKRQLSAVENLAAIEIGQRNFGRRDEIEIPIAADLEKILFELRKIARAAEGIGVDEKGRLDFRVTVLARMQLEHEVDQRAGETGAGAHEHGEARPGHASRTFEVDNPECRPEIPVRLGVEIHGPR